MSFALVVDTESEDIQFDSTAECASLKILRLGSEHLDVVAEHDCLSAVEGAGAPRDVLECFPRVLGSGQTMAESPVPWLLTSPASLGQWRAGEIGLAHLKALFRATLLVHGAGYSHRDIQPPNVLVHPRRPDDAVLLIDFGYSTRNNRSKVYSGSRRFASQRVLHKLAASRETRVQVSLADEFESVAKTWLYYKTLGTADFPPDALFSADFGDAEVIWQQYFERLPHVLLGVVRFASDAGKQLTNRLQKGVYPSNDLKSLDDALKAMFEEAFGGCCVTTTTTRSA